MHIVSAFVSFSFGVPPPFRFQCGNTVKIRSKKFAHNPVLVVIGIAHIIRNKKKKKLTRQNQTTAECHPLSRPLPQQAASPQSSPA